ncbi:MAG: response regulator, partial [Cellulosilyticaceae bacterium]
MYKIALIDDEAVVREGMKDLINWEKIGLELIGTAEDGEEGLRLVQTMLPDIILLDINMPKLNGLDLAHIIRKNYDQIKIILISGYDAFDYARQALRMGVEDYILKPVTKSEMTALLQKVVGKLDQEKELTKKESVVLNKIAQSIPLMQQKLLEELVFSGVEPSLIHRKCVNANIPSRKRYYSIFLLGIDEALETLGDEEHKLLTHFAVQNIVGEMVLHKNWGILFEINHLNAVLYFTDEEAYVAQAYDKVLRYIHSKIKELLGITVTIGVGQLVGEINEIFKSYNDAYNALISSFFEGRGSIVNPTQSLGHTKVNFKEWVRWEQEIIKSMDQQTTFSRAIGKLCMDIKTKKMLKEDIEEVWNHIACAMLKKFVEIDPNMTAVFPQGISIREEIAACRTLLDMQIWMDALYNKCYAYMNHQANPNRVHMNNILAYIDENYALSTLSMKMVCEGVHMSPSHLSNIFKKELGM